MQQFGLSETKLFLFNGIFNKHEIKSKSVSPRSAPALPFQLHLMWVKEWVRVDGWVRWMIEWVNDRVSKAYWFEKNWLTQLVIKYQINDWQAIWTDKLIAIISIFRIFALIKVIFASNNPSMGWWGWSDNFNILNEFYRLRQHD